MCILGFLSHSPTRTHEVRLVYVRVTSGKTQKKLPTVAALGRGGLVFHYATFLNLSNFYYHVRVLPIQI